MDEKNKQLLLSNTDTVVVTAPPVWLDRRIPFIIAVVGCTGGVDAKLAVGTV